MRTPICHIVPIPRIYRPLCGLLHLTIHSSLTLAKRNSFFPVVRPPPAPYPTPAPASCLSSAEGLVQRSHKEGVLRNCLGRGVVEREEKEKNTPKKAETEAPETRLKASGDSRRKLWNRAALELLVLRYLWMFACFPPRHGRSRFFFSFWGASLWLFFDSSAIVFWQQMKAGNFQRFWTSPGTSKS